MATQVSQARGGFCLRGKRGADGRRLEESESSICHGKIRDLTVHEPEAVIAKRAKCAQAQLEKQKEQKEKQKQVPLTDVLLLDGGRRCSDFEHGAYHRDQLCSMRNPLMA